MNHARFWAFILCLAVTLSVSPSYGQDADDESDPALDAAEGDVLVQDEPGGGKKITFICRVNKDQGSAHRHGDSALPTAVPDCELGATEYELWSTYAWAGTVTSFKCELYPTSSIAEEDLKSALINAFSVWRAAEAAAPLAIIAPPTTSKAPPRKKDGRNVISFGALAGGTLAVTQIYLANGKITEFDMTFNKNYAWKAYLPAGAVLPNCGVKDALYGEQYDVEHIAAHECGHAYGISHPKGEDGSNASANPRLTMYYAGSRGETHNRTLNLGDIAAIQARY